MRIAISSDHRGADAVSPLADRLAREGHEVIRVGDLSGERTDYPDTAYAVGSRVASGEAEVGVLICGTGIGMSIAANKVRGVRAALVTDELTAELSREHNNANVLCLSADLLGARRIDQIVDRFIATEFEGGRHERRVNKISEIEAGRDPTQLA